MKGKEGDVLLSDEAKTEMINITRELMPDGEPDFQAIKYSKSIASLVTDPHVGRQKMIMVILMMVKNFCSSVNVKRNMNEYQALEASVMLVDEAGNFRLEDYHVMFTMAKRGQLVQIFDRIDIQVISQMILSYENIRDYEGQRLLQKRDEELRQIRLEKQQKQLISGHREDIVLPENYFQNELAKLKEALNRQNDQSYKQFIDRASDRKKELLLMASQAWGRTEQEIFEEMNKIEAPKKGEVDLTKPPKEGQIIINRKK